MGRPSAGGVAECRGSGLPRKSPHRCSQRVSAGHKRIETARRPHHQRPALLAAHSRAARSATPREGIAGRSRRWWTILGCRGAADRSFIGQPHRRDVPEGRRDPSCCQEVGVDEAGRACLPRGTMVAVDLLHVTYDRGRVAEPGARTGPGCQGAEETEGRPGRRPPWTARRPTKPPAVRERGTRQTEASASVRIFLLGPSSRGSSLGPPLPSRDRGGRWAARAPRPAPCQSQVSRPGASELHRGSSLPSQPQCGPCRRHLNGPRGAVAATPHVTYPCSTPLGEIPGVGSRLQAVPRGTTGDAVSTREVFGLSSLDGSAARAGRIRRRRSLRRPAVGSPADTRCLATRFP